MLFWPQMGCNSVDLSPGLNVETRGGTGTQGIYYSITPHTHAQSGVLQLVPPVSQST